MSKKTKNLLQGIFDKLLKHYGPQEWWPGETPFEVMVGAILTQNTNWRNVEKAIGNLKSAGVLELDKLLALADSEMAELIRPAGYFNVKTKRLKSFLNFFQEEYDGNIATMQAEKTPKLREKLLGVKGVGKETADSILLYALEHPIFVVDAYTYRVFTRHYLIEEEAQYDDLQALATDHLPEEGSHYNEYHALLVMVGKDFCRPKPKCENCPLKGLNW